MERIKSLEKCIAILTCISRNPNNLSLEEITKLTNLKKTTCFRLLKSMKDLGLIEMIFSTKRYTLGPKIISLGLSGLSKLDLHKIALPFLKRLSEETGETVNLSILDGTDILFIERIRSEYIFNINLKVGDRLPAIRTSQGKVILSYLSTKEINSIIKKIYKDLDSKEYDNVFGKLNEEFEMVRRIGFYYSDGELEKGLCGIAAPIFNHEKKVVAAINVAYGKARHDEETIVAHFSECVMKTSKEISEKLGFYL